MRGAGPNDVILIYRSYRFDDGLRVGEAKARYGRSNHEKHKRFRKPDQICREDRDEVLNDSTWVDMHTHSTASDGDLSPAELVAQAKEMGLGAVGITDHDTMSGVPEAISHGEALSLEVIHGVELSVEWAKDRTLHLLGYCMDLGNQSQRSNLDRLQCARAERNERILERLEHLGMPLDRDRLRRCAGGGQVGRPHLAQVMVQQGYVATVEEAFARFLGKGKPAYVNKFRLGPEEAIAMIRSAGGVPVLAHPYTLGCQTPWELESLVARWVEGAGLMGIEVLYPDHGPQEVTHYRYLAEKYDLVKTGGTDFHGKTKPEIALGWGRGDLRVPYAWVDALRRRASGG